MSKVKNVRLGLVGGNRFRLSFQFAGRQYRLDHDAGKIAEGELAIMRGGKASAELQRSRSLVAAVDEAAAIAQRMNLQRLLENSEERRIVRGELDEIDEGLAGLVKAQRLLRLGWGNAKAQLDKLETENRALRASRARKRKAAK